MTTEEENTSSDQSISWNAYREAERIADLSLLNDLKSLCKSRLAKVRGAVYFTLGALSGNTGADRCVEVLLAQLAGERQKFPLEALLDAISRLNLRGDFDLRDVRSLTRDERWLVRQAAIRALGAQESPSNEECLLGLLAGEIDARDVPYVQASLGRIGSARCLPHLEASLRSRKEDIRVSARHALAAVTSRVGESA